MRLISGLFAAALLLLPLCRASAQHEGHPTHGLRVDVDGSQTPDRIPDSLAYDHWFKAVAETQAPAGQAATWQKGKLSPLALSQDDYQKLVAALASFKSAYDQIELQRSKLSAPRDASTWANLRDQETALTDNTRSALASALSPQGWATVNDFVTTHVKQHIKIYVADTAPGSH